MVNIHANRVDTDDDRLFAYVDQRSSTTVKYWMNILSDEFVYPSCHAADTSMHMHELKMNAMFAYMSITFTKTPAETMYENIFPASLFVHESVCLCICTITLLTERIRQKACHRRRSLHEEYTKWTKYMKKISQLYVIYS